MMRYTELAWGLCASSAVARLEKPSRDRQVKILTFQLTTKLRLLPVPAWPSHDGKERGNSKSEKTYPGQI